LFLLLSAIGLIMWHKSNSETHFDCRLYSRTCFSIWQQLCSTGGRLVLRYNQKLWIDMTKEAAYP
jgi:hypothetical protein